MEATELKPAPVLVPPRPSLAKLAAALAKAQGQMANAKKDTENPYFNSKYADLAAIWDVARKPLSENGLCVIQKPTTSKAEVTVVTTLIHESGEEISDILVLPVAQPTPQGYGSAITYARRYGLSAMLGIAAEADDDGNAASHTKSPATQKYEAKQAQKAAPAPAAPVSEAHKRIRDLLDKYDLKGKPATDLVTQATGKADRKGLDDDDVARVEAALVARAQELAGDVPK